MADAYRTEDRSGTPNRATVTLWQGGAYGLTKAERLAAAEKCGLRAQDFANSEYRLNYFLDMDCNAMLRETLALGA
ncbi:hypothetical protein V4F39_11120 [Aquincola sp. MAHUQ-54]|uniref:Uncharacterized protein n=1 Tax=Aquincola agrisoli TaxID=3119538 RepID=A0AAW9QFL8_9BURK